MSGPSPVTVQPTVRAYVESQGASGRQWLATLPSLVEHCCRTWGLVRGEALPGGSRSYVCRVSTAGGRAAVLKVALPEAILATQMTTLTAARGRGYVQVLAHDRFRGALLLEALGSPLGETVVSVPEVLTITAQTLLQAWRVPREDFAPLPAAADHKAASLAVLVRDLAVNLDASVRRVVDQALAYAEQRFEARDPARQVVVHGDPHAGNLLSVQPARPGAETGYVFVDPEGFLCEPEYDLGVSARGWNEQLSAVPHPRATLRAWCAQLARETGADAEAVWQWAYLERVSTGLYLRHHGLPELGAPFLAMAGQLLE